MSGHCGRHGGGILDTVLFEQEHIEIPAAVRNRFGLFHGALVHPGEGKPGRKGEAFLRGSEQEINAPLVHGDLDPAQRRDRVDRDERIRAGFLDGLAKRAYGVLCAGGGLVMDDKHQLVVFGLQRIAELIGLENLPPLRLDLIRLLAVSRSHIVPALGKCSIYTGEDAFFSQVAHGHLLHPGTGMGALEDTVLGEEDLLQPFAGGGEHGFKILAAVRQHGFGLGSQNLGVNIDRAGDKHGGHSMLLDIR